MKKIAAQPEIPSVNVERMDAEMQVFDWHGLKVKHIETLGEQSAAGLSERIGILVLELEPANTLYKAGLRAGDVIRSIDHYETKQMPDLLKAEKNVSGKEQVEIQLWRNQAITKVKFKF